MVFRDGCDLKLLVTGANGFLGRYVVAEALRRGHAVRAALRSAADVAKLGWANHPNLEIVRVDLRSRRGLVDAVAGTDAVLHLAAAKSGDMYAQYAGTVVATENLLAAMTEANVRRIVVISSLSVYNYLKIPSFSLLSEDSPLETDAFQRDEYAHTKLVQERLVRDHATQNGWGFTVLRPGVIYGKDNLFTARLGMQAGRVWIRTGAWAKLPLTYVENCAEAIVLAAENDTALGQTLNVIDDDPPTQRRYAAMLRRRLSPRPVIIPVAWSVMRLLAGMAVTTNKLLFKNRAKIPGLFIPARLHARCKQLRFTNQKIKATLGWKPRYSVSESLDRSLGKSDAELTKVDTPTTAAAPVENKAEVAA
ncbi:MAG: NAD-dependent epimerase/dehydratase [Phycisphaerales bacterium]|nr:NAD-dependent epimerase/dehydratase [Phycisphaerales bacterium]